MLKRVVRLWYTKLFRSESKRKKQLLEVPPLSLLSLSLEQKDLNVRVIHAGGLVELYEYITPASQVMKKYPRMCLARPDVFKQPHRSLVKPDEKLFPGQKFYLIPCTTVQKLKRKNPEKSEQVAAESEKKSKEECAGKDKEEGGSHRHLDDDLVCSAKDFYVSREKWARCVLRRCGRELKKPFSPPIKKPRMWEEPDWQPSLTSVKELSP